VKFGDRLRRLDEFGENLRVISWIRGMIEKID
jgi:hypothetical protein